MKIWQKIILGFMTVIAIMIIVDSSALMNNIRIIDEVEDLERSKRVELTQSNKIAYIVQRIKSNMREIFLEFDHPERKDEMVRARAIIESNSQKIVKSVQLLSNATHTGYSLSQDQSEIEEISKNDSLSALVNKFIADIQKNLELMDMNKFEEANDFFENHTEPVSRNIQDLLSDIVRDAEEEVSWAIKKLNLKVSQTTTQGIILTILSILLSIAIGLYISKSISTPLYKLIYGTKQIEKGNMETSVNLDTKGELGLLADSFNTMTKELKNRIATINKLNKDLEESNQTKDKFFSIIAHDLKAPFNIILGFTDLLTHRYYKLDDKKRYRIIQQLNQSSKSIYELLENLLTWARSQSKKIELLPKNLNLLTLIDKCIASFERNAGQKNITIKTQVPEDITVIADVSTLTVVINNTINNAIKFTPENGFIHISAKKTDDTIEFSIADTGIGMSKESIDDFLRSRNIESTLGTNDEKGTGLGLVLIKDFIERNNGHLSITSEPGKGTVFTFVLPGR